MPSLNGMHIENIRVGQDSASRDAIIGRDGAATLLHLQAAQVLTAATRQRKAAHMRRIQPLGAEAWRRR
jgi:hypothetical protein